MGVLSVLIVILIGGICMLISGMISAIGIGKLILMIVTTVLIGKVLTMPKDRLTITDNQRGVVIVVLFIILFRIAFLQ